MEVLVVKFGYRNNEDKILWLLCMTIFIDYLDDKLRHLYQKILQTIKIFALLFHLDSSA